MAEPAVIFETDTERDRKTCVALDLKVTGANRELAQWLLDHPRYSNLVVAGWISCSETRIGDLRRWARNGFRGPTRGKKRPSEYEDRRDDDSALESLDNLDEIAEPAVIEDNALFTIQRMNEHARVFKKFFKASPLDREARERINTAIERMIQKWRSTQATLTRSHDDGKA